MSWRKSEYRGWKIRRAAYLEFSPETWLDAQYTVVEELATPKAQAKAQTNDVAINVFEDIDLVAITIIPKHVIYFIDKEHHSRITLSDMLRLMF